MTLQSFSNNADAAAPPGLKWRHNPYCRTLKKKMFDEDPHKNVQWPPFVGKEFTIPDDFPLNSIHLGLLIQPRVRQDKRKEQQVLVCFTDLPPSFEETRVLDPTWQSLFATWFSLRLTVRVTTMWYHKRNRVLELTLRDKMDVQSVRRKCYALRCDDEAMTWTAMVVERRPKQAVCAAGVSLDEQCAEGRDEANNKQPMEYQKDCEDEPSAARTPLVLPVNTPTLVPDQRGAPERRVQFALMNRQNKPYSKVLRHHVVSAMRKRIRSSDF